MPHSSWLFIKGSESIWVERPHGRLLIVCGPGESHQERDFISEQALDRFQIELAERLADAGWFLWGVNRDRRVHAERRRSRGRGVERRPQARTEVAGPGAAGGSVCA